MQPAMSASVLLLLARAACSATLASRALAGPLPPNCQAKLNAWCNTAADTGAGCAAEIKKTKCLVGGMPQQFVARIGTSSWDGTVLDWRCYAPSVLDPTKTHFANGTCYCSMGVRLRDQCIACAGSGAKAACGAAPVPPPPPAPPPPGVVTTTVFAPGDSAPSGGGSYEAFRIPGMLAFKDTLMVFAEGRKYGCGDFAGKRCPSALPALCPLPSALRPPPSALCPDAPVHMVYCRPA